MDFLINTGIFLLLLGGGYFWGTRAEKKHYQSILAREAEATDIIVIASKHAPENVEGGEMVMGSVVIASDYFKRFVAGLIGIFGGRLNIYESLLDRARREAMLRMKDDARAQGADIVVNFKFETATLNDIQKRQSAMVEVLAYGSACKYRR